MTESPICTRCCQFTYGEPHFSKDDCIAALRRHLQELEVANRDGADMINRLLRDEALEPPEDGETKT
ncbi:MAG: hypothetical protein CL477_11725 [Acidobacteria bacterium]|jgi:hypothetical protein|nr:hypothetical protein [Acidobacteriota bacterium]MDP7478218.1 hypothetical protein [Vicinamibacterales bacterium]HJN44040.1 hypothetical protein [Vicinamibacterales bacterium]|tara:strand:- start:78 stop:278 length:201 start_codon:yes stop_codon:yes gene_type:complete